MTKNPWTAEDDQIGVEAFNRTSNDPKEFLALYNTLSGRQRSASSLFHRLMHWIPRIVPSSEFIAGLRRMRDDERVKSTTRAIAAAPTPTAPAEVLDRKRWLSAAEIAKRTGYTESWVRAQHKTYGRVERKRFDGLYYFDMNQIEKCLHNGFAGRQMELPGAVSERAMATATSVSTDSEVLHLLQRKLITPERAAELLNQRK